MVEPPLPKNATASVGSVYYRRCMGYNARNDEIRDNITRMRRERAIYCENRNGAICETLSSGPRPLGIDSLDAVVRAGLSDTRLALSFGGAYAILRAGACGVKIQ
jgi:hypothetical protein